MTRTRAALVAALAALTFALTSCGGETADTADTADTGGDRLAGAVEDLPAMAGDPCEADVAITGDVEAAWSGEAAVVISETDVAPPASYQSNHDDVSISLASAGNGFEPTVIVLAAGSSYGASAADDTGTIDVAPDGSGAEIDVEAAQVGVAGTIHVVATFSC